MLVTTCAVAASLIRALRENAWGFRLGEYLQLIFCVAMGSLASMTELSNANGRLFLMVAAVQFTAIILHIAPCALFRVDADTVLITSTATIFGPAFIGPVARSLNNRQLLFAGIATALVGVAVANYLGLSAAWLLKPSCTRSADATGFSGGASPIIAGSTLLRCDPNGRSSGEDLTRPAAHRGEHGSRACQPSHSGIRDRARRRRRS